MFTVVHVIMIFVCVVHTIGSNDAYKLFWQDVVKQAEMLDIQDPIHPQGKKCHVVMKLGVQQLLIILLSL